MCQKNFIIIIIITCNPYYIRCNTVVEHYASVIQNCNEKYFFKLTDVLDKATLVNLLIIYQVVSRLLSVLVMELVDQS